MFFSGPSVRFLSPAAAHRRLRHHLSPIDSSTSQGQQRSSSSSSRRRVLLVLLPSDDHHGPFSSSSTKNKFPVLQVFLVVLLLPCSSIPFEGTFILILALSRRRGESNYLHYGFFIVFSSFRGCQGRNRSSSSSGGGRKNGDIN